LFKNRVVGLIFLLLLVSGCTRCIVMRSEYFDVTGKVFAPKSADVDMPVLAANPAETYERIGTVRAWARYGTSPEAIRAELKRRALLAGADALMNLEIGEDEKTDLVFCGRVFSTKRNISGKATAIVYGDAAGKSQGQADNPAMYNL